ncbi:MAG: proline--tRNA ligase [Candidatus Melainabacteria bacterium GWF2_37_15]|nr:MAG: proline--tRNA ligase [Candidatus Melainabacteria bacterium GWF2_37_15]
MRMTKLFFNTLRETPADAEVISHQFLVRAGYIRKLTSGIYTYLPLMLRVIKKISNIIREEMDAQGAQELLMPILQPEELWKETGRWEVYGKELMRLTDRHGRMGALGPTHEEIITALARDEIKSYRQLPVNLYQIQDKFRDEIRPRFGLLRGREFLMKDAYSFDADEAGLEESYKKMIIAYTNIFNRCGLETRMVRSDSGAIGGSVSHEFMVLTRTQSGENDVLFCDSCDYAANSNRAESRMLPADTDGKFTDAKEVDTPGIKSIEDLAKFFNIAPSAICKSLVYIADKRPVMALIRGDQAIEETKLLNAIGANEIRIASDAEVREHLNAEPGFMGPVGVNIQIIGDESIKELKNFVVGINKADKHLVGANWDKEIKFPAKIADIRLVQPGEGCPECEGKLETTKGIEVGNIFKLGTKYSEKMKATFTDENGQEKPFIMGCYGIGVSRTAAAAVERYHDKDGIQWPIAIAPYHVVVVPVNVTDEQQMSTAEKIYNDLLAENIETVLDDRDERPGVKFKDADLIGFSVRITAGKTLVEGMVEIKIRSTGELLKVPVGEAVARVKDLILKEC